MKLDMKVKPEDKPKLIGIGFALLGAVIYMLITLIPKLSSNPNAPADPATGAAQNVAANGAPPQAAPPLSDKDVQELESDVVPQTPSKDIFAPPRGSAKPPEKGEPILENSAPRVLSQGAPVMQPTPGFAHAPDKSMLPHLIPGMQASETDKTYLDPANQGGGGGTSSTGGVIVPMPASGPSVQLAGVIVGGDPVAVVVVNGVTYNKRKGDTVGGNLKISSIEASGVTVLVGTRTARVSVGHMFPNINATVITVTSSPADTPEALAAAMKQQGQGITDAKPEVKPAPKH